MKMAFFTPAVLSEIIHQLVLNYFPLTFEVSEIIIEYKVCNQHCSTVKSPATRHAHKVKILGLYTQFVSPVVHIILMYVVISSSFLLYEPFVFKFAVCAS